MDMSPSTLQAVACERQTHFRSSLLSLLFGGRGATTGNASAVRRLYKRRPLNFFRVSWPSKSSFCSQGIRLPVLEIFWAFKPPGLY